MDEFTALFSRKDMTFEEAVAYFKERVPVTASRFYQIAAEYRTLAFTVSGYTKAQVLKKFYDELLAALEEGNSLAEFRENMNDFLEAEGYEGITPYQAENIFRTNIQTAYNVGHYKRMTEPGVKELRPYWQYDAVNDSKTRPSHLAMDGRVFMADDPIWDTWFPPNGFKCRCTVKTLSKRQMEQRDFQAGDGIQTSDKEVRVLEHPQQTHADDDGRQQPALFPLPGAFDAQAADVAQQDGEHHQGQQPQLPPAVKNQAGKEQNGVFPLPGREKIHCQHRREEII